MNRTNVIAGIVCFMIGAFVYWMAMDVPSFTVTDELGGRFFPQLVAVMFMIASAGLIITGLKNIEIQGGQVGGSKAKPSEVSHKEPEAEPEEALVMGFPARKVRLYSFAGVLLVYTFVLDIIGYIPASFLTFMALIYISGEHRPLRVVIGSVIITAILYLLFAVLFGMNVPEASIFQQ